MEPRDATTSGSRTTPAATDARFEEAPASWDSHRVGVRHATGHRVVIDRAGANVDPAGTSDHVPACPGQTVLWSNANATRTSRSDQPASVFDRVGRLLPLLLNLGRAFGLSRGASRRRDRCATSRVHRRADVLQPEQHSRGAAAAPFGEHLAESFTDSWRDRDGAGTDGVVDGDSHLFPPSSEKGGIPIGGCSTSGWSWGDRVKTAWQYASSRGA